MQKSCGAQVEEMGRRDGSQRDTEDVLLDLWHESKLCFASLLFVLILTFPWALFLLICGQEGTH